jgi:hypothetical protein
MSDLDKLEQTWRDLEAKAQRIMADKDEAIAKVRERYADKQRQANQDAADAQKAYLDADAAAALLDRPDGADVAAALGLTLPE